MKTFQQNLDKQASIARSAFEELLDRETKLAQWQQFFATYPHALSASFPLALRADRLVPAAGSEPPDWIFYAHRDEGVPRYGALELEGRAEAAAGGPEERIALLVEDVAAAVEQCEGAELGPRHANRDILCLGNRWCVFFVIELTHESCDLLEEEVGQAGALPRDLHLLTYAELRTLFGSKVAPLIMLLASTRPREPDKDPRSILARLRDRDENKSARCG